MQALKVLVFYLQLSHEATLIKAFQWQIKIDKYFHIPMRATATYVIS